LHLQLNIKRCSSKCQSDQQIKALLLDSHILAFYYLDQHLADTGETTDITSIVKPAFYWNMTQAVKTATLVI
jgi:methylglyoxal synthase